jgi:hypothetical protein
MLIDLVSLRETRDGKSRSLLAEMPGVEKEVYLAVLNVARISFFIFSVNTFSSIITNVVDT